MRQRFLIVGALISLVVLLIGLNAASYVQKQKLPDTEFMPNRSTYNTGSTGTQAFYSLLSETGRKVVRWQEPPDALKTARNKPSVFVVIGQTKREFTEAEAVDLYQWVYDGGRLIIVDRESAENLVRPAGNWKISFSFKFDEADGGGFGLDPADPNQITAGIAAAKPVQPTAFMSQINGVQPSRLAATIEIVREAPKYTVIGQGNGSAPPPSVKAPTPLPRTSPSRTPVSYDDEDEDVYIDEEPSNKISNKVSNRVPPPANKTASQNTTGKFTVKGVDEKESGNYELAPARNEFPEARGPVVHLANNNKTIMVDVPHGSGSIVYLSDPYILSNAGIRLVDNAQLGVNIVGTDGGIIAFDEYHQGFGANSNRLFQYFAGTPVIAIFAQCAILIGLLFFSQSRRFARAVPEPEPNRLSKLEYVAAMAELQARTRSFDLAIENIYTDFRRRVARLLGVDNYTTTRNEMSKLIAERIKLDPNDVEDVLFQCEDIMHGEPTNKKEVLTLIGRLRYLEEKLGLKRTGRTRI